MAGPYEVGLRSKNVFDCAPRGRSLATIIILTSIIVKNVAAPSIPHARGGCVPPGLPMAPILAASQTALKLRFNFKV